MVLATFLMLSSMGLALAEVRPSEAPTYEWNWSSIWRKLLSAPRKNLTSSEPNHVQDALASVRNLAVSRPAARPAKAAGSNGEYSAASLVSSSTSLLAPSAAAKDELSANLARNATGQDVYADSNGLSWLKCRLASPTEPRCDCPVRATPVSMADRPVISISSSTSGHMNSLSGRMTTLSTNYPSISLKLR